MLEPIAPEQNPPSPKRIRMSRQHPWRADNPDAVIVSRPSKWGNDHRIGDPNPYVADEQYPEGCPMDAADVVNLYRAESLMIRAFTDNQQNDIVTDLGGHDLACWCPLDQPCHADVLLELANGGDN